MKYFFFFFLLLSCTGNRKDTQFTKLSKGDTGINFRNLLEESADMNVLSYIYFYNGGGVAVGDVNNDGLQDLFFAGNMVKNRLFLNKGNFKFEDITTASGVATREGWCTGATMADVNNDGRLDIYVCRSADVRSDKRRNLLFINEGEKNGAVVFSEQGAVYGIDDPGYSTHAAFFDMDRDGDLDLFLANHSLSEFAGVKMEMTQFKQKKNTAFNSKLYRNDNGHFQDVTEAAGITANVLSFGLGIGITDVNNDNWPDIYVCNDFNEQDYLFVNNQNGTFTDRLPAYLDHTSLYSMGCDWADFNNDGRMDLVTVDMLPEDNHAQKMHGGAENYNKFQNLFRSGFYYQYSRNMLHLNQGNGAFAEIGQLSGVSNTDWSWAALGADFDNDGAQDLLVTNGYVKDYTSMDFLKYTMDQAQMSEQAGTKAEKAADLLKRMSGSQVANYLFHNENQGGVPVFKNVAAEWGLGDQGWSYGAAYADLDNDGDLDIITSNINDFAGIYRNNAESKNTHNWLKINLKDPASPGNKAAIGAKVSVWAGGKPHYREMMPSRGYASSVDYNLSFGLGANAEADSVVVIWPDGSRQTAGKMAAKQTVSLQKQTTAPAAVAAAQAPPALFAPAEALPFQHRENPDIVDFKTQGLLPQFLSHQGPCMAQADVNSDGLEDIFIGGAKGAEGALLLASRTGKFANIPTPAFVADKNSEDTGACFLDADGDGDPDLYVVSGGYAFAPNDPALQDRLYLNDGRGHFTKSTGALPPETASGSCARAADMDGDGDLDLFIGGRVVPGRYPETPESFLLINDGKGHFSNQTTALAPALAKIGMVTDACWMDLNNDRRPELILVGEWMSPRFFDYQQGKLAETTPERLGAALNGWWNCLAAKDLDGDGDTDMVLGNLGLNTQIRADVPRPASLDYADFDENGSVDPLFSWHLSGKSYPAAYRDDLAEQLPMLKKKFTDYKIYADATVSDFFPSEKWAKAQHLTATEFRTGILRNDHGKFTFEPLPIEAQFAPVYAALCFDANGDGHDDLLLAGNNRYTRIRFGRYDANHGTVLAGDGKGHFEYVPAIQTGLNIRADVRSMGLVRAGNRTSVVMGINDGAAMLINRTH